LYSLPVRKNVILFEPHKIMEYSNSDMRYQCFPVVSPSHLFVSLVKSPPPSAFHNANRKALRGQWRAPPHINQGKGTFPSVCIIYHYLNLPNNKPCVWTTPSLCVDHSSPLSCTLHCVCH
jgi:hypothetical protein